MSVKDRRLTLFVADRAICKLQVDGESLGMHFYNPSAVAIAGLLAASPLTEPMVISFWEAEGYRQVVDLLRQSPCPVTAGNTADFTGKLLDDPGPGRRDHRRAMADALWKSGGCVHSPTVGKSFSFPVFDE